MKKPTRNVIFSPEIKKTIKVKNLLKQAQFHGLNKLDDAKCRSIWTLSLFLLLLASTGIAANIVLRFLDQPTFILRIEKIYPSMEFPSVQICPELSYPEYKIDEFLSRLDFPPHLNKSYIKRIIQQLGAFYSPDVSYTVQELQKIQTVLDLNKVDVYSAAKNLTTSCEEILLRYNGSIEHRLLCRLFGVMKNCTELFHLEISQYGFCCIFNGRSLRSEIREYGIHKVLPKSEYYTQSVGFRSGLIVAVNQNETLSSVDLTYKWVSIDGGHSYIDSTVNGTPLAPGTEMWLAHRLEGISIDENAANLGELRGCKLTKEPLDLFPVHHKKYCQLECEIYHLLKTCGCGMWTHPLPPEIPVCRANYLPCARQELTKFNKEACPCVHTCDVDDDYAEISSFRLIQHSACLDSFYHGLDFSRTSIVRVFVTKQLVNTKTRMAFYSFHDLFAQLGGFFNVFFGCSLLSILEIIQIIKYACINRRKPRNYTKNNELEENKAKNEKGIFKNAVTRRRRERKKARFCFK